MPRLRPLSPSRALPATVTDLLSQCVVKQAQPKLVDEVQKAYFALYADEHFRALRGDPDPESTIEGDPIDDDVRAAEMLRIKGDEMGLRMLATAKTSDIRKKMRVAEARFNASRKQRSQAAA